jgi:hypothetical protein
MTKGSSLSSYEQLASQIVDNVSNQRTREIINLRFGLKDGQRQTLEAIGQKYGITRERVRQVEEAAFSDFRKPALVNLFEPVFKSISNFFNQEGSLIREEKLLTSLTSQESPHPSRGALFFVLTLGQPYRRFVESDKFYSFWTNSLIASDKADWLISYLVEELENKQEPVSLNYILSYLKQKKISLAKKALLSYLDATKQIDQDNFGHFGLSKWPQINPRGVKDKAYIIFKEAGRPLHFREVAQLINQSSLGSSLTNFDLPLTKQVRLAARQARPQTVHNELIKDSRFILVGRGTYALGEWGYQPGTVRQILIQILKENGPLTKEEILNQVLKNRLVKPNTVLINLQNREYFNRDKTDKYTLVK